MIAIICILAAIALPAYQNDLRKPAYTEVILSIAAAKLTIDNCYAVEKN